jgi:hypothetical protein
MAEIREHPAISDAAVAPAKEVLRGVPIGKELRTNRGQSCENIRRTHGKVSSLTTQTERPARRRQVRSQSTTHSAESVRPSAWLGRGMQSLTALEYRTVDVWIAETQYVNDRVVRRMLLPNGLDRTTYAGNGLVVRWRDSQSEMWRVPGDTHPEPVNGCRTRRGSDVPKRRNGGVSGTRSGFADLNRQGLGDFVFHDRGRRA